MIKKSTSKVYGKLIICAAFLFITGSVHAQCTANFSSFLNGTTGDFEFHQLCTFDTSIHPVLFIWDFGDGGSSSYENPTHHYQIANNYTVCLILYVGNGPGCCQDTFCTQIDYVSTAIRKNEEWMSGVAISTLNKNVSLHLSLPQQQFLKMDLITVTGKDIPVTIGKTIPRGKSEIVFTMTDYPTGIYMIRIEDEAGHSTTKRFLLY